ncbi:hypothetical protein B0H14DRAFT_2815956 [Mycena olivaceomarginata]|nr:hypothetical protein B0H14DRAFT_2815956 [Mycena olivaceomarginata]
MNYTQDMLAWTPLLSSAQSSPTGPSSDEYDPNDFDQPQLTSDSRPRPHRTVPPSHTITSDHTTRVAISRQDVRSVLNSSASFRPPSPAPRFNAFPTTPLESPLSSFPPSPQFFGPPPVFPSTNELAAHYGLPQNLPPPPRPVHRRSSYQPAPKSSSPVFDFDSIRKNYLTMLSQAPSDPEPAATDHTATAPPPSASASAVDKALQDLMASPEFRDNFDATSPLFEDSGASPLFEAFDVDAYLTSPMETPYDDFATSPADDSPFSDFINTPVLSMGNDTDMLTGPLIDDGGYGDSMSLFGGLSTYSYEVPAESAPKLPSMSQLYTISPSTPALESIDPTSTVFPKPKSTAPVPASPAVGGPTTRRRTSATGTRKNLKPEALIPLEAPTQKRTYVTPSATSRKAVPAVFQKKRQHSVAFGDDDLKELGELSPTASEQETIEYKRRQNTLAARKSRKRKLEHQHLLEEQIVELQGEVERWKTRALMSQDMLRQNGIPLAASRPERTSLSMHRSHR